MKRILIITFSLILATVLYGYSQFGNKEIVSAVLQHQINLENPPGAVSAICTSDQKIASGKNIPKGTRFIGKLSKEGNGFQIYFDSIQTPNGQRGQLLAKSNLNVQSIGQTGGVSAKIGQTLYRQTQNNVLGAIFKSSSPNQQPVGSILPKGSEIKIEID